MEIRLNLLPEEKRDKYRYERLFSKAVFWGGAFSACAALLLAALYGISLIVSLESRTYEASRSNDADKGRYEEIRGYDEKFMEINGSLDDLDSMAADQLYWSRILGRLSGTVPDGIAVSSLATADYLANMTGEADSRDALVALRDALSADECFQEVNLPLSDLVEKDDIDFQMTFKVSAKCLKSR